MLAHIRYLKVVKQLRITLFNGPIFDEHVFSLLDLLSCGILM